MKQISNYKAWAFCIAMLLTTTWLSAQTDTSIPKLIQKNGRYTLLVDNKPFFVLGGQCGNSSNWASMLPNVWNVMKEMHANTLEIPVYWEQLEPLTSAVSIKSGTAKQYETYLPLVCHLEERKQSLHARMDENRF